MNKKFLSAILFGALMITSTGTFVSCKDYDDDIKDLQTQIDNLATKADVEAKLSQLQTALAAAQADATKALADAKAADDSAEIAALEAKIAAFKSCSCDVEAMKAEIKEATDAQMKEYKAEIEALIKKTEDLVGKVADFVTSVELVASSAATGYDNVLTFSTAIEKENLFSKDIANAITFVKDDEVQTPDQFLLRVSPTNAVLTPEMISLVNSKGENLDELIEVTEVKKFDALLTTPSRAAENNGLWVVKTQLKAYGDGKAFAAAQATNTGKIVYAAQINNSISVAETRYVTSTYDLTLNWEAFKADNNLLYKVDGVKVGTLKNRIYDPTNSPELTWKAGADAAVAATTSNIDKNVDNRTGSSYNYALAVQGEALTISLYETVTINEQSKDIAPKDVRAIYVTLDKKVNAHESAPSEWNAWNGYTYTGLNTVVEGTSTTITIDSDKAINDIIGFRVYAVNYDGTLVDPDGKAFYALVGKQADDWTIAATSITPVSDAWQDVQTEKVAVELAKVSPAKVTFTVDDDNELFKIFVYEENATAATFALRNGESWNYPSNYPTFDEFVAVTAQPVQEWYKYEDGKTYYGTLTAYDATGFEVGTLRVSFTKNIPTAAPEGFSVKTNQVVNGVYNCYLIPMKDGVETWTAKEANQGSMAMDQIFNFPTKSDPTKYTINFATTKYNGNKKDYTDVMPVAGNAAVVVNAVLIDNESKHVTTATYDYGYISSVNHAAAVAAGKANDAAYNVIVEEPAVNFETVYNCIYNDTYTWAWATREQLHAAWSTSTFNWMEKDADGKFVHELPELTLTYGTPFELQNIDMYIFGQSAWDAVYNSMLNPSYMNSLSIESATFTSDANGKQEYFAPDLTTTPGRITKLDVVPNKSNPNADVASTLTIKCKDMYGHERVITIPAVVKPRK